MKAMGYAQQVIESISYNTSNGTLSWIGKKSGENSGSGSINIKEIKVNNSGYADSAGRATNDANDDRIDDTYAKKSDGLITYVGISGFDLIANRTYGSQLSSELPVAADGSMGVKYYYLSFQGSKTIYVGHNIFKIDIYLIGNDGNDSDNVGAQSLPMS